MATISLIIGIISLVLCWFPIYGLIISILCVVGTALLKRRQEYGKKRRIMKAVALVLAIAGVVISIFVTGLDISNATENALIHQTNEGALNDVRNSFDTATLAQAQQKATYAWNEARMKGYKNEKMEQYIYTSLQNAGINTTNLMLEITKTGVTVKTK